MTVTFHTGLFNYYLPCDLYWETDLSFGPRDLAALPPLRLPNVTFLESVDFTFAIVLY
jgi:hypothetical protein